MTKKTLIFIGLCILIRPISIFAQPNIDKNKSEMNRIDACKENFHQLFGGEALSGKGDDPEMMDILQKFIFGDVFSTGDLGNKTREMITCTTLATMQTLPQLKAHANAALNVGVSPLELREMMYLCAPFIGFPKALNAIATVDEVLKERGIKLPLSPASTTTEDNRYEKGKEIQYPIYGDEIKEKLKGLPDDMGNKVAQFLTEYGFGDIYSRSTLDIKTKELLVYCSLTALGADFQLKAHAKGNLKVGNDKRILTAAVIQCLPYVGFPAALKALDVIQEVR